MLKFKNLLIIFLLILFILFNFSASSLAFSNEVTKEGLENSFNNLISEGMLDNSINFIVNDDYISISSDSESYDLKYDLSNNPTFYVELPVYQGMSYDEFQSVSSNTILPIFGYIAVADIQGVGFEDSSTYFLYSFLESALASISSGNSKYVIVDDLNSDSTPEISEGQEIIYTSEFGNHVMEYVNSIFETSSYLDDSNYYNTFGLSLTQQNVSDTSCNIVSTLNINSNSDFSNLIGFSDSQENPPVDEPTDETPSDNIDNQNPNTDNNLNNDIVIGDDTNNDYIINNNDNSGNNSETSNNNYSNNSATSDNVPLNIQLPKTGINMFFCIFSILVCCISAIIFGYKIKFFKDI